MAFSMASLSQAAQIDVIATQTVNNTAFGTNVDAITVNTTWTKDNVYILKDKVFVTNGATLTIQPGTKIYSTLDDNGTPTALDDDAFGSLCITRGAKIEAAGTAAEPIIFTTTDELEFETQTDIDGDTLIADAPTATTYARWGGLVVLGNAPITVSGVSNGTQEDRIEGFQPAASADLDLDLRADVIEYGGSNAADDSGTISYVVIRHGGYIYAAGSEINGLTLGGVGSGTQIDHVEVFANADDGIEFFGGTVNTSYISLVFNQDDSFDIDQGYNGTNQFWFCVQAPFAQDGVASGHDNGGEWDGTTGTITDAAANSSPTIYNATFIGSGTSALAGNDKGNNAIFIDDRMRGFVYNSVFDDFGRDLVGAASDGKGTGLTFGHNTVGRFGDANPGNNLSYVTDSQAASLFFNATTGAPLNSNSNGGTNPKYREYSRDDSNNLLALDPRPATDSPLLTSNGATLQAGAPVATTYRGAFGSVNWAAGWTTASEIGLFEADVPQIDVIATQTVNNTAFGTNVDAITVNTTWTKDNVYILKDKVFVTNGATLTIQPGTKIYSTLDDNGTPTALDDDAFGSLCITRGAKIEAAGTAAEPIIFTTTDELEFETQTDIDGDTLIADAPTATTYARWGGLVVLGNAPITVSGVSNGTQEDRIEGFQPAASADLDLDLRADVIEYGGSNAADDSGTISYVVIRHGGYIYAAGSEINGLTLGGVGSGTQIDHVEVFANADDGIEFFGGTVNTSYISLVFNQDDSFDIDQGYNGTNQFWFCVQAPFAQDGVASGHDNGGEWDGTTGTITDAAANSSPTIYNATFIGSGTSALAGNDKGNNAIFIDDRMRGFVYNSVFDDFGRDLVGAASDGKGTGLTFGHNTVGRFGDANPGNNLSYVTDSQAASLFFNATTGAPLNSNSNGGTNPKYREYSRDDSNNLLALDPRPATDSPLLTSNGATLQAGAPVATTYRGAFGSVNWAAGWTTASAIGLLEGEADSTGAAPFADVDNDGVSDTAEVDPALAALGFVVGTDDSALFADLFTETSILDLRTTAGVTVQKTSAATNNVTLTVPVQKSTGLDTWEDAGVMTLGPFTGAPGKEFYRLEVQDAN